MTGRPFLIASAAVSIYGRAIACTSGSLSSYVGDIRALCSRFRFSILPLKWSFICLSLLRFTENFGSLPASPPLGGNFRRLQSHHVTRTCMVGVREHRSRTILSPTTLLERVWGLHVYLSERGAVVSPQAGTYEYPFLAVGVAPGSLLPCYESAYRWFSGPSQTPKKNLLDHPFRHKHRDALPPTT
ncbi:hypothetical protein M5K25_011167 [Dendrobium thyrsiflorum]|uniref:Secreted protein n=1 Tax=Dendrobium thyrsiflorum TaxID=117978 RepID=A0ABD0V229_DENTH